jgi:hypothetical protein
MAGKFEDVLEVKKITKKIEGLLQQKGSYSSEFYFSSKKNFNKTINEDLTEKLLKDFDSYILNPINRILVVFFLFIIKKVMSILRNYITSILKAGRHLKKLKLHT